MVTILSKIMLLLVAPPWHFSSVKPGRCGVLRLDSSPMDSSPRFASLNAQGPLPSDGFIGLQDYAFRKRLTKSRHSTGLTKSATLLYSWMLILFGEGGSFLTLPPSPPNQSNWYMGLTSFNIMDGQHSCDHQSWAGPPPDGHGPRGTKCAFNMMGDLAQMSGTQASHCSAHLPAWSLANRTQ